MQPATLEHSSLDRMEATHVAMLAGQLVHPVSNLQLARTAEQDCSHRMQPMPSSALHPHCLMQAACAAAQAVSFVLQAGDCPGWEASLAGVAAGVVAALAPGGRHVPTSQIRFPEQSVSLVQVEVQFPWTQRRPPLQSRSLAHWALAPCGMARTAAAAMNAKRTERSTESMSFTPLRGDLVVRLNLTPTSARWQLPNTRYRILQRPFAPRPR